MSLLPEYFEVRHFSGSELELIPVWNHRTDIHVGHVEGMLVIEYLAGENHHNVLTELLFKSINQLVPMWQPRLFVSDQRLKQVCQMLKPILTHGHCAFPVYQDNDCPTKSEVFIKYTQQADGLRRLVIIVL